MYQRPLYNQTSRCMAVLLLKTRTGANKVDIYTDNNDGRVVGGGGGWWWYFGVQGNKSCFAVY